jgi:hypothetical protein
MHWMITKVGESAIIANPGAFEAERQGAMTHEIQLVDVCGNVLYKGVCTNPALAVDPSAPQVWAGEKCTGTFFRLKDTTKTRTWMGL